METNTLVYASLNTNTFFLLKILELIVQAEDMSIQNFNNY